MRKEKPAYPMWNHEREEVSEPIERAAAAAQEVESRRFRERQAKEKAAMSFSDVNFTLKDLTDEELEDLKSATLSCLPPNTAEFLKRSNARCAPTLRYHMANRLRGLPVG